MGETKGGWFSKWFNIKTKEKEHGYLAQGHCNVQVESMDFEAGYLSLNPPPLLIVQNLE